MLVFVLALGLTLFSISTRALVANAFSHAVHIQVKKRIFVLVCQPFDQHDWRNFQPERWCRSPPSWHNPTFRAASSEERCGNTAPWQVWAHSQMSVVTATGTNSADSHFVVFVHLSNRSPCSQKRCTFSLTDVNLRRIHGWVPQVLWQESKQLWWRRKGTIGHESSPNSIHGGTYELFSHKVGSKRALN